MIEKGGHYSRWYIAAPAHDCSDGLRGRIKRWLMGVSKQKDGRRRIDPTLPYGHWAAGWQDAARPQTRR